jgi:c-di-AMP phosphodiesterase-like protein
MEAMNGGGHMTAAAMQKKRCSIDELEQELLEHVDTYFKEVDHESDSEE